jgi:hypothetical protein
MNIIFDLVRITGKTLEPPDGFSPIRKFKTALGDRELQTLLEH